MTFATEIGGGQRKPIRLAAFYTGLSLFAALWTVPLLVLVFTALKSAKEFAETGTFAVPESLEWENFPKAWDVGLKTYFVNSTLITLVKVPLGVLICTMAAFALTKMRMPSANSIFAIFVVGLIVPIQMTLVPLTILYQGLGLIDRIPGLIFMYLGFGLPLGILVMRGFMRTIPGELIEAAFIDGASWWGIFRRIIVPLSRPAWVSLLILDGISTWNEFILAQIFIRTQANRTVPLGVVNFSTEFATAYELLAAAQVMSIVPLVLLYLFFQRYFVHGLGGAVK